MKKEEQTSWFSNGNLIISGEYFVLAGAKALAVPLKFGQSMKVDFYSNNQNIIHWKSSELGNPWFSALLDCENLNIKSSSNAEIALRLQKLLKAIHKIKPELFDKKKSYLISSDIQFNLNWGWGSSSTLVSNLANWAGIDPFELNQMVSSGSGYDIAVSLSPTPILYQINKGIRFVNPLVFNPVFKESILFIYLGKKQSSEHSIERNLASVKKNKNLIPLINDLTEKFANEKNILEFARCITEHEKIISGTIKTPRIKEKYFSDFEGEIKSLGAWGGDFAMTVSRMDRIRVTQYFKDKKLETIFRFDDIIKSNLN